MPKYILVFKTAVAITFQKTEENSDWEQLILVASCKCEIILLKAPPITNYYLNYLSVF